MRVRKGKGKEKDKDNGNDRSGPETKDIAEKGEKSKIERPENKHDHDEPGPSVTGTPKTTADNAAGVTGETTTEETTETVETEGTAAIVAAEADSQKNGKKKKRAACQFHTGKVLNKVVRLSIWSYLPQTEGGK